MGQSRCFTRFHPKERIRHRRHSKWRKVEKSRLNRMDRKEFFQEAFRTIIDKGIAILDQTRIVERIEHLSEPKPARVRPPGASHVESEFLAACTGCDACMAACPVNVIMIENLERRDPIIYPDKNPCIHCPGYPCISSCPTGALDRGNGTKLRLL